MDGYAFISLRASHLSFFQPFTDDLALTLQLHTEPRCRTSGKTVCCFDNKPSASATVYISRCGAAQAIPKSASIIEFHAIFKEKAGALVADSLHMRMYV